MLLVSLIDASLLYWSLLHKRSAADWVLLSPASRKLPSQYRKGWNHFPPTWMLPGYWTTIAYTVYKWRDHIGWPKTLLLAASVSQCHTASLHYPQCLCLGGRIRIRGEISFSAVMPCAIAPPTLPHAHIPHVAPCPVALSSLCSRHKPPEQMGALRSAWAAGDRQALSANGLLGNQLTAPHSARCFDHFSLSPSVGGAGGGGGISEATDRSGGGLQQQQQQVGDLTPHHAFPPRRPGTDRIHRRQIAVNRSLRDTGIYKYIYVWLRHHAAWWALGSITFVSSLRFDACLDEGAVRTGTSDRNANKVRALRNRAERRGFYSGCILFCEENMFPRCLIPKLNLVVNQCFVHVRVKPCTL